MSASYKAVWAGAEHDMKAIADALGETLDPPADAVSLTCGEETADWRVEAYFSEAPDMAMLAAFLKETVGFVCDGRVEETPDIDWVAHALEGLGVVRAGRFQLYGVHDADKINPDPALISIRIDANQAFGTGHHPTTAGCLEALDRLGASRSFENPLDLGTGSAILAIAAAKLWDVPVLATDIDAKAVAIASENIALNGVDSQVRALEADGFDSPAIAERVPFDLIIANILAGPLIELASEIAARLAPGGAVILAGLLAKQEESVLAAYADAGLTHNDRVAHPEWPVLILG